jgi:hypothetical protein
VLTKPSQNKNNKKQKQRKRQKKPKMADVELASPIHRHHPHEHHARRGWFLVLYFILVLIVFSFIIGTICYFYNKQQCRNQTIVQQTAAHKSNEDSFGF